MGEVEVRAHDAAPSAPQRAPSKSWPYLLVALGVLGVGVAAWRPVPAGVWHDDGVYMLVGKAIAGGHGLTYHGVVGAPVATKFPPAYPALLASLWIVLRGIGAVTLAATFLNLGFLAVAAGFFAKALHDSTGLSLRLSASAAGLGFVSTDLLRTALVPLSESLFLALAMAAFALWPKAAAEEGGRWRAVLALLLVAVVATRSAGLALVAGFAVALGLRTGVAAAAVVAAPALVFTVGWSRWAAARSADIQEGMRDLLGPYGSWLSDQAWSAPAAFSSALPSHALGVLERVAAIAVPGATGWLLLIASAPLAGLTVVGLVALCRRFPPLGWSVIAYLGMLLLWPYLDRRLVAPIHPALVAALVLGASLAYDRLSDRRARGALVGALAIWIAAYSVTTAARVSDGWPTAPYRLRAERLASAVEALDRTAPDDAVVGAPEFWAALHLHGGWTVAPSVRFDPRSVDPEAPMWGTPVEQISLWRAAGIDHLLLEQAGALHGAALDRLEGACPGTVFVLAQMPPLIVVRLAWRPDCAEG